jgi:hypothetical protein
MKISASRENVLRLDRRLMYGKKAETENKR